MYKYVPLIITVLALIPLAVGAQTTTNTSVTDTSAAPQTLPQTFMRPMGTSTEPVEHGEVTVDIGIDRRFSESPSALKGIDISANQVINARRLQVLSRHIALSEPVEEMSVGEDIVRVRLSGDADLFGFIPIGVGYEVTAELGDDGLSSVQTTRQSADWWSWLASKPNTENISQQVEATVADAQYLSITQLRAVVLEAIIDAV